MIKNLRVANKKKILGLVDRRTFKVIEREEIPSDANHLPVHFVLVMSIYDSEVIHKARFAIGG